MSGNTSTGRRFRRSRSTTTSDGKRYRSLGCYPYTNPVESDASTVREIIEELRTGKFANIAERSGRAQDSEDEGGLEALRRDGHM